MNLTFLTGCALVSPPIKESVAPLPHIPTTLRLSGSTGRYSPVLMAPVYTNHPPFSPPRPPNHTSLLPVSLLSHAPFLSSLLNAPSLMSWMASAAESKTLLARPRLGVRRKEEEKGEVEASSGPRARRRRAKEDCMLTYLVRDVEGKTVVSDWFAGRRGKEGGGRMKQTLLAHAKATPPNAFGTIP